MSDLPRFPISQFGFSVLHKTMSEITKICLHANAFNGHNYWKAMPQNSVLSYLFQRIQRIFVYTKIFSRLLNRIQSSHLVRVNDYCTSFQSSRTSWQVIDIAATVSSHGGIFCFIEFWLCPLLQHGLLYLSIHPKAAELHYHPSSIRHFPND